MLSHVKLRGACDVLYCARKEFIAPQQPVTLSITDHKYRCIFTKLGLDIYLDIILDESNVGEIWCILMSFFDDLLPPQSGILYR